MGASVEPCAGALRRLGGLALRANAPAQRLCGSVRAAVVYAAALLGAYLVTEGSVCLRYYWGRELDLPSKIIASLALVGAIGDITVLAAILGWGRWAGGARLTRLLCSRLALAVAHLPLAPFWMLWGVGKSIASGRGAPLEFTAWEAGRLAVTLVLAALLFTLLTELHPAGEEALPWVAPARPPPAAPSTAAAGKVEEPTPGPAPPPRRPH